MIRNDFCLVVGGATAGSETARMLAEAGFHVIVLESQMHPYGKIRDGLPLWHGKLRQKECAKIDAKLDHPHIHLLLNTGLDEPYGFAFFREKLGIQLMVLANGASQDRPLNLVKQEALQNHQFARQNDLIRRFNEAYEKAEDLSAFRCGDEAIVIGGGLASLDVLKVCQLDQLRRRLSERGIPFDLERAERKGLAGYCQEVGAPLESLAFKPSRLMYRKTLEEMPLVPLGADPSSEEKEQAVKLRRKLMEGLQKKFAIQLLLQQQPTEVDTLSEGKIRLSAQTATGATVHHETDFLVSAIGSIPAPLKGIPHRGETYDILDPKLGSIRNCPGVFVVGNALTGRGNILASVRSARAFSKWLEVLQAQSTDQETLEQEAERYAALFELPVENAQAWFHAFRAELPQIPPQTESQKKQTQEWLAGKKAD